MPRAKEGYKIVTVLVPQELADAMATLAEANGRSFTEEAVHAFERHMEAPPRLRIETPPLRVSGRKRKPHGT